MATVTNPAESVSKDSANSDVWTAGDILRAIGSLKLTVFLFAASLVIVLVGTLAQDEMNMQDVKERYFVSWVAWMHFDDFFPQAFLPHAQPIPGVIPFPGGAMIGALLMLNLIAAKGTRFKVFASGTRLIAGGVFLVVGFIVAGLIIASGHNSDGLQGAPPISYDMLWRWVQGLSLAGAAGLVAFAQGTKHRALRIIGYVSAAIIAALIGYTFFSGTRIGDPGLRIVWQLAKGLGAGLIMLAGSLLIFGRQGGNLLLHFGVGLLMVGQFAFGDRQLEQRISLVEGESTNALINLDKVELAFIASGEEKDVVTAIPGSKLVAAFRSEEPISAPALPVDVKVLQYFENSDLVDPQPDNPATTGLGKRVQAKPARKRGGADAEVNIAAAYVELLDKETGEPIGTYLVSQLLSDRETLIPGGPEKNMFDTVTINDNDYKLGLKYHREVKPYWVHLEDVQRRNYSGTETPRDYSSYIRIVDPETGEDRRERVWMNNPLRYRGETFFQSSYTPLPGGKELTGLQVVRNSGWLIPYVACSIMALGMLAHFTGTLKRFVGRRERETAKEFAALDPAEQAHRNSSKPVWIALATAAVLGVMMLVPWPAVMNSVRPQTRDQGFDFYAAGKIPTQFGGRVMPLDAFARQTLKAISNKESLPMENAPEAIKKRVDGKKMSAIQWLMEVASDQPELRYLPMFRIDAEEVRSQLKLERRKSKLYSLDELLAEWENAQPLLKAAKAKDVAAQSFKERKLLELDRRTRQFTLTSVSFRLPRIPDVPMDNLPEGVTEEMVRRFMITQLRQELEPLQSANAARVIPPTEGEVERSVNDPDWKPFALAFFNEAIESGGDFDADNMRTDAFSRIIETYADADKKKYEAFNDAVDDQLALASSQPIPGFVPAKVGLERWMESNSPSTRAMILYLIALIMGLVFFAVGTPALRKATWGVLLVAFLIHSVAILSRIYITGRAPVINIYSSAVFIGWASAIFGLVIERVFRLGFGNMLAAVSGVLTLLVASGLSTGDTMPVLQAVLDTQFWLATHVISVSLGYVATLVAGTLGAGYLVCNWLKAGEKYERSLYRMIYGAACFGILFSTIGTILGGLWADDSWGRFWGWDPKENGALLIVIWNALMLHARWDGMVKARGFAILAIGGNIVTAWSWFGTNELGIGLHSYGFTEGVLMWLSIYIGSQLLLIAAGLLTRNGQTPSAA
jgi:ABC-type transport system involved in cytochrome c biogenesis permease subunit